MGDRPDRIRALAVAWLESNRPWCVLCARVEELLPLLPGRTFQLVEADPPYGTGEWRRAESGAGSDPRAVHHQAEWDRWDPSWVPEALRVSAGPVLVWCPLNPVDRLHHLLGLAVASGQSARVLPWVKPDPRPRFGGQPAWAWEPVVALRSHLLHGGESDVTVASSPREGRDADATGHPHQKPAEVLLRLVRQGSSPGDRVLSLFGGSGTTAEACVLQGRRVLVVEADPAWCTRIAARLEAATARVRSSPLLPLPPPEQIELPEVV